MKKFTVYFEQINRTHIEVDARNKNSAKKKAIKKYKKDIMEEVEWLVANSEELSVEESG